MWRPGALCRGIAAPATTSDTWSAPRRLLARGCNFRKEPDRTLETEPLRAAARAELALLADQLGGGGREAAGRGGAGEEVDVDTPDLLAAELDVADRRTVIGSGRFAAAHLGDQRLRHHAGRALGEDACLGGAHAGHIAHGIDAGKTRLQVA